MDEIERAIRGGGVYGDTLVQLAHAFRSARVRAADIVFVIQQTQRRGGGAGAVVLELRKAADRAGKAEAARQRAAAADEARVATTSRGLETVNTEAAERLIWVRSLSPELREQFKTQVVAETGMRKDELRAADPLGGSGPDVRLRRLMAMRFRSRPLAKAVGA